MYGLCVNGQMHSILLMPIFLMGLLYVYMKINNTRWKHTTMNPFGALLGLVL
jgi:hypothetical protein